ncbi:MAG: acyl--CoA ligase [Candidatus Methanomethyliaceae archaeon]|nr:acyl--CoA ligase [Candidatus Methanomethyliaceae archaeon]
MVNFTSFLDTNASYYRDKPAIVFPKRGETMSYRKLLDRVDRLAEGLRWLGVRRGDRVMISTGNAPETIISYFATWRVGAVAVPVNPDYKVDELGYLIEDSEPKVIIAMKTVCDLLSNLDLRGVSVVSLEGAEGTVSYDDLMRSPPVPESEECSLDTLCQIQYTSGTTGKPKGAILTHGNWMAAVEAERWALGLTEEDVYLGFYPHFHIGVSWGITSLRYGATFIIMERYKLEEFLDLAKSYRATVLSGMPPVLYALASAQAGTEEFLAHARCIITGGAPTPEEVWKRFAERYPKISVVNAYGLSETVVLGTGTAVPANRQRLSKGFRSVGLPVGFSEVKIVDENDPEKELNTGQVGEVALRGPGVCKGYWRREEETRKTFIPGGWFLTGDLGYVDEDGVLYIASRKKDVIIMSGWKIYPAEVESVLVKHPKIAEAAVFAKYDEIKGEIPAAAVVLKEGAETTAEDILEFCRRSMASYKVPRQIVFLESLPKIGGWKVLRRALRDQYGGFPVTERREQILGTARLTSTLR